MNCVSCGSSNQEEFLAKMAIHFPSLKNLDKPHVLIFPKTLVCLECGHSQFSIPENQLRLLREGIAPSKAA
jgi:hypothetical protein